MAGMISSPERTTYVFGPDELKRILCEYLGVDWRDRATISITTFHVSVSADNLKPCTRPPGSTTGGSGT